MTVSARRLPASTYRLQLHRDFTFEDVRRRLEYLDILGVTHLYFSPVTEAVPGSMHGYDVVDPTRINPELGGEDGFRALAAAVRGRGMGIVLDIVPNHMSTSDRNVRWMDVLCHGQSSMYAHWFDIDWQARDRVAHRGKVLVPVLGDELERVLERGELTIEVRDGDAYLRYFDRRFPLAPGTHDGGETASAGEVRSVLERQHYVLEYWRAAKSHVDYRRFFTIDELIGVRVEDVDVFRGTHELFAKLMEEGLIDGVRVDHADGLSDPAEYFRRLRVLLGDGAYIVAEKILSADEPLPPDWPIDGTTGYEVMDLINSVFVDGAHEEPIRTIYASTTGRSATFEEIAYRCRKRVLDAPLAGQFERAARQLYRELDPPGIELAAFAPALHELMACLPVYRTYHSPTSLDPMAESVIEAARTDAAALNTELDAGALEATADVLAHPPEHARIAVMRLQQLMPAVQAKAIEDSAFYRYAPLLSLCEVGSDPAVFGRSPSEFHAKNLERARRWPGSMLATATHDHKRGEDVRARINALSELPDTCASFLEAFRSLGLVAPSALDEYVLCQTALGIWPLGDAEEPRELIERLQAYLIKAAREAGERTSWDAPAEEYEAALTRFAAASVEALASGRVPGFVELLHRITRIGQLNSLGQVVLKIVSPGTPDTYQGTELWDLSLVDPDNRRPVDYERRAALLAELHPLLDEGQSGIEMRRARVGDLIRRADEGAVKLYVLARALRVRREVHPLCTEGDYLPVEVRGALADNVVAFARRQGSRWLLAAVTRLAAPIADGLGSRIDWRDTMLVLPAEFPGSMRNLLTEEEATPMAASGGVMLPVQRILSTLPVAILGPAAA